MAHVDGLVISHGDLDHVGVFESLGASIGVHRVISNVSTLDAVEPCIGGVLWTDGATRLEVLRPRAQPRTDLNNDSCVRKIQPFDATVLLSGNIEARTERELLLAVRPRVLKSDVLIAPHHGSFTSSTAQFVRPLTRVMSCLSSVLEIDTGYPTSGSWSVIGPAA